MSRCAPAVVVSVAPGGRVAVVPWCVDGGALADGDPAACPHPARQLATTTMSAIRIISVERTPEPAG